MRKSRKGYTLITGTDQGIYAEISPHPTSLVLTSTMPDGKQSGPYEIPMEPKALLEEAQKGGYWSYIAGVAYQVLTNYHVHGLVIDNYQDRPAHQKGPLLQRGHQCAGGTCLQPSL